MQYPLMDRFGAVLLCVALGLLVALVAGCASEVITYDIPPLPYGVRVNRASEHRIHQECFSNGNRACAFYEMKPCEVWLSDSKDILHEETHCALGKGSEIEAQRNDW